MISKKEKVLQALFTIFIILIYYILTVGAVLFNIYVCTLIPWEILRWAAHIFIGIVSVGFFVTGTLTIWLLAAILQEKTINITGEGD